MYMGIFHRATGTPDSDYGFLAFWVAFTLQNIPLKRTTVEQKKLRTVEHVENPTTDSEKERVDVMFRCCILSPDALRLLEVSRLVLRQSLP